MQPDFMCGAKVGDRNERIDRPGIRRAGICANGDRRETFLAGIRDGQRQSLDRQPIALIGADDDDAFLSYADDPGRPLDRRMRLVAQEDGRPFRRTRLLASGDQCVEDRSRAAGGEEASCRFGVADPLTEPVDDDQFELAGTPGAEPRPLEGVESRRQDSRRSRLARSEPKARRRRSADDRRVQRREARLVPRARAPRPRLGPAPALAHAAAPRAPTALLLARVLRPAGLRAVRLAS